MVRIECEAEEQVTRWLWNKTNRKQNALVGKKTMKLKVGSFTPSCVYQFVVFFYVENACSFRLVLANVLGKRKTSYRNDKRFLLQMRKMLPKEILTNMEKKNKRKKSQSNAQPDDKQGHGHKNIKYIFIFDFDSNAFLTIFTFVSLRFVLLTLPCILLVSTLGKFDAPTIFIMLFRLLLFHKTLQTLIYCEW